MNILLGLTGSVATILGTKLVDALSVLGEVRVVLTPRAKHFTDHALLMSSGSGSTKVFADDDEWTWYHGKKTMDRFVHEREWTKGDPILHIQLRDWADCLVVAPMSANTLGEYVNGLCPNLLTSIMAAWDRSKPMVFAFAMNTHMWQNPFIQHNVTQVRDAGVHIVEPQEKTLACGDVGVGAMADISKVADAVQRAMDWRWPLPVYHSRGLPLAGHPGSFGYDRNHDIHTGVDLYCDRMTPVRAMERGKVIKIVWFTGKYVIGKDGKPMDWWHDTKAILVEGPSGVIVYGEVEPLPSLQEGDIVETGDQIAKVRQVLKGTRDPERRKKRKAIPGHSLSMLHVELYSGAYTELERWVWEGWEKGTPKPDKLLDPTPKLKRAKHFHIKNLEMKS